MTSNALESIGKAYTYMNTQLVKDACLTQIDSVKEKRKAETDKIIKLYRKFLANARNHWICVLLTKLKIIKPVPEPTFEDAKRILDALSANRTEYYNPDIREFYPSISYTYQLVFIKQLLKLCETTQEEKILLSMEAINTL